MKLVHYNLAGRKQVAEVYESEAEYQEVQAEIEKVFGKMTTFFEGPWISLNEVKKRRFHIKETHEKVNPSSK